MGDGKQGRDILADILSGAHPGGDAVEGLDLLRDLIRRQEDGSLPKPAEKKARKTGREGGKKKTTHYISPGVEEHLAQVKERLQALVPEEMRAHVSKSSIVDNALRIILAEFVEKGEKSPLMREILKRERDGS